MSEAKTASSLRLHQRLGFLLAFLLFGGVGGWVALASISGAVIAEARVVVETSAKKIQHDEGGIVAEILIADGGRVEAGQLLIRLDQTTTRANLAIINATLDELTARRARLEAERDNAVEITFPADVAGRLDDPLVSTAYAGQKSLFGARREARQGEQNQLRYKIEQLGEEIHGLEAQQTSKERQLSLINDELTSLKTLQDKGLVRLNRILALERELARLEGERGALTAQIAGKRGEIGETHLRIIQIDKNLSSEIITDLRETQAKAAELMEKRIAAEIRLKRTEIRAPQSGTIHQLAVHTLGGFVAAGEPVMFIVPQQDELIFEARISPIDIDQVQIGQRAVIRLHAVDPGVLPEMAANVMRISPDSITDTQTNTQFYIVRIQVAKDELAMLGARTLVPGMLAEAFIETQTHTVLRYLLKPLSDRVAHAFRER
jgi:HlyD family secretion protein